MYPPWTCTYNLATRSYYLKFGKKKWFANVRKQYFKQLHTWQYPTALLWCPYATNTLYSVCCKQGSAVLRNCMLSGNVLFMSRGKKRTTLKQVVTSPPPFLLTHINLNFVRGTTEIWLWVYRTSVWWTRLAKHNLSTVLAQWSSSFKEDPFLERLISLENGCLTVSSRTKDRGQSMRKIPETNWLYFN